MSKPYREDADEALPSPTRLTVELEASSRSRLVLEVFIAGALCVGALVGLFLAGRRSTTAVPTSTQGVPGPAPVSAATVASAPAAASPPDVSSVVSPKPGWRLTFHDEFDGTVLDPARWIDSYPGGERTHSNNEQQYYAPEGVRVGGGHLRFTAEEQPQGGMPYTSGMVCSQGRFSQKYGWFEIRTRIPKGKGMWPAFWLLPESRAWPPEIDVLEILGSDPATVLMSDHWGASYTNHQWQTGKWTGPDFSADFHTFAVEWKPDAIIWYVDGAERYRTTQHIPQEPMYVLANLAVGGDLPGMPDASTPFPGTMDVDYIRVYERAP